MAPLSQRVSFSFIDVGRVSFAYIVFLFFHLSREVPLRLRSVTHGPIVCGVPGSTLQGWLGYRWGFQSCPQQRFQPLAGCKASLLFLTMQKDRVNQEVPEQSRKRKN
eukprot:1150933-Pelagomonas_calceolata.AAC.1